MVAKPRLAGQRTIGPRQSGASSLRRLTDVLSQPPSYRPWLSESPLHKYNHSSPHWTLSHTDWSISCKELNHRRVRVFL